eukprot:1146243-Ditylum_brightwellii.AAC.1
MLRAADIGLIGTARFHSNWPPSNLKDIDALQISFNELFWTVDNNYSAHNTGGCKMFEENTKRYTIKQRTCSCCMGEI